MAKKKVAGKTKKTSELAFEDALEKLEDVVTRLEDGQQGLSQALAQYEAGMQYLKQCYALLDRAERRIELLTGMDAEGRVEVTPFDEGTLSLEQKQQKRARRRSQHRPPASADPPMDEPPSLF